MVVAVVEVVAGGVVAAAFAVDVAVIDADVGDVVTVAAIVFLPSPLSEVGRGYSSTYHPPFDAPP